MAYLLVAGGMLTSGVHIQRCGIRQLLARLASHLPVMIGCIRHVYLLDKHLLKSEQREGRWTGVRCTGSRSMFGREPWAMTGRHRMHFKAIGRSVRT